MKSTFSLCHSEMRSTDQPPPPSRRCVLLVWPKWRLFWVQGKPGQGSVIAEASVSLVVLPWSLFAHSDCDGTHFTSCLACVWVFLEVTQGGPACPDWVLLSLGISRGASSKTSCFLPSNEHSPEQDQKLGRTAKLGDWNYFMLSISK